MIEVLLTPLRIAGILLVFAPVLLVLALFEKLGEVCSELGEKWSDLAMEYKFLMTGVQRKATLGALRENRELKEQLRLLRETDTDL